MKRLNNIRARHLWIFICGAFVFKIVVMCLEDFVTDTFIISFKVLPTFLQHFLYPVSDSMLQLNPTDLEIAMLFGIRSFENLLIIIEISYFVAFFWIIYLGLKKLLVHKSIK